MVDMPGTYYLQIIDTSNNCTNIDSIIVEQDSSVPLAEAGDNATLDCNDSSIALNGQGSSVGGNYVYTWTTQDGNIVSGINSLNPTIDLPGWYYIEVYDGISECSTIDSVLIEDNSAPITGLEITGINPCYGDNIGVVEVLDVQGGIGPFTYSLNNGSQSTEPIFENLPGGTYVVTVTASNGCTATDTITLFEGLVLDIDVGGDHYIDLGESVQLQATINIPDSLVDEVVWSPFNNTLTCHECMDPIATPFETTVYTATLIDIYGCMDAESLTIYVDRRSKVYAPNVFSPNGDGTNDEWTLFSGNQLDNIDEIYVYNRWGELVWENQNVVPGDLDMGWDGTFKGESVNPAVFAWYAKVTMIDGTKRLLKGDVTVIK
jgi:gliding motility-associated-like protein